MQFNVKTGKPEKQRTACLIAGVYENGRLSPTAAALDAAGEGSVTRLLKGGDLKGKPGQTLLAHQVGGLSCDRLLLVGCGKNGELAETDYRKAVNAAMAALKATAAKEALCCLAEIPVKGRDVLWKVRRAMEAAGNALYRFDQMKSDKNANEAPVLQKLHFIAAAGTEAERAKRAVREGKAVNAGLNLAKTLADLPGNVCTPTYLAEQAQALGRRHKGVKVRVLEEKDMEKLGMGALLSVARGSRQPAKLITLEYKGAGAKKQPVALVGKGLTFDAGGISLKPAANMDEMKYDMCGAAAVLGTLEAAAELELPLNLVGVIPSSENLPDGDANKPGDIVTSLSGQTIEVLNTDAEGRLILCDALTYTKKFAPEVVIDIATLTGACVIALGGQASGLLGNNQELADALLAAGQTTGDRAWQLPLWDEYQEQLKSNFADMANIGGREAGTITAACFLSRYTKDYRWAHLDIAGTAWRGGKEKGATGRPVPLLMQYLIDRAQEKGRAK